ncbi:MAG: DSD1 family PLP-dependent enzyme, partial [Bacteroidota bacterium]
MQAYFEQLNQSLRNYHRALPCLLIDLDQLDENIKVLKKDWKADKRFRIVVKSLPSWELIDYVMKSADTQDLMVFHQPFLSD